MIMMIDTSLSLTYWYDMKVYIVEKSRVFCWQLVDVKPNPVYESSTCKYYDYENMIILRVQELRRA